MSCFCETVGRTKGRRGENVYFQADEFIRRFLLHTLPLGLQRIRYYGFLGNRRRSENLTRCRQLLDMPVRETVNTDLSPHVTIEVDTRH
jgi:hypothetical protein